MIKFNSTNTHIAWSDDNIFVIDLLNLSVRFVVNLLTCSVVTLLNSLVTKPSLSFNISLLKTFFTKGDLSSNKELNLFGLILL